MATTAPRVSYAIGRSIEAHRDAVNGTLSLLPDAHGSNRALINPADGSVVESYAYQAYGEPIGFDPNAAKTIHLFGGDGEYDAPSKLYYHDSCWRGTHRFVIQDPTIFAAGDVLNANLYRYAASNAVYGRDPTGLFSTTDLGVANSIVNILASTYLVVVKEVNKSADAVAQGLTVNQALAGFALDELLAPIDAAVEQF